MNLIGLIDSAFNLIETPKDTESSNTIGENCLHKMNEKTEELCEAAFKGDLNKVKSMISTMNIEDINNVNTRSQTPIYCASRSGNFEILKILLSVDGVNVNTKESHGSTPLHAASFVPHPQVLSVLLTYGCDISIRNSIYDDTGLTARQEARGEAKIVWDLFLSGGANALQVNGYPVWISPVATTPVPMIPPSCENQDPQQEVRVCSSPEDTLSAIRELVNETTTECTTKTQLEDEESIQKGSEVNEPSQPTDESSPSPSPSPSQVNKESNDKESEPDVQLNHHSDDSTQQTNPPHDTTIKDGTGQEENIVQQQQQLLLLLTPQPPTDDPNTKPRRSSIQLDNAINCSNENSLELSLMEQLVEAQSKTNFFDQLVILEKLILSANQHSLQVLAGTLVIDFLLPGISSIESIELLPRILSLVEILVVQGSLTLFETSTSLFLSPIMTLWGNYYEITQKHNKDTSSTTTTTNTTTPDNNNNNENQPTKSNENEETGLIAIEKFLSTFCGRMVNLPVVFYQYSSCEDSRRFLKDILKSTSVLYYVKGETQKIPEIQLSYYPITQFIDTRVLLRTISDLSLTVDDVLSCPSNVFQSLLPLIYNKLLMQTSSSNTKDVAVWRAFVHKLHLDPNLASLFYWLTSTRRQTLLPPTTTSSSVLSSYTNPNVVSEILTSQCIEHESVSNISLFYLNPFIHQTEVFFKHTLANVMDTVNVGTTFDVNIVDPIANQIVSKVKVDKRFSSKAKPLLLGLQHYPNSSSNTNGDYQQIIFKKGDDLRQDMYIQTMFCIFNELWNRSKINPKPLIYTYKCIPLGDKIGCIQCVTNVCSVGANDWYNLRTMSLQNKNVFLCSLAGCFLASYVLGVRDRHHDNMLIKDGHIFFHIDFGHLWNQGPIVDAPRLAIPTRVKANLTLQEWAEFESICESGFEVLHQSGQLIKNISAILFSPITPTNTPTPSSSSSSSSSNTTQNNNLSINNMIEEFIAGSQSLMLNLPVSQAKSRFMKNLSSGSSSLNVKKKFKNWAHNIGKSPEQRSTSSTPPHPLSSSSHTIPHVPPAAPTHLSVSSPSHIQHSASAPSLPSSPLLSIGSLPSLLPNVTPPTSASINSMLTNLSQSTSNFFAPLASATEMIAMNFSDLSLPQLPKIDLEISKNDTKSMVVSEPQVKETVETDNRPPPPQQTKDTTDDNNTLQTENTGNNQPDATPSPDIEGTTTATIKEVQPSKSLFQTICDDMKTADDEKLQCLIKQLPPTDINNQTTETKLSLLHLAVLASREEIVKTLLNVSNINVNQCDIHGRSATHIASFSPNPTLLSLLLSYGIDPTLKCHCFSIDKSSAVGTTTLESTIIENLELKDGMGVTAEEIARGGSKSVWKIFKEEGIDGLVASGLPICETTLSLLPPPPSSLSSSSSSSPCPPQSPNPTSSSSSTNNQSSSTPSPSIFNKIFKKTPTSTPPSKRKLSFPVFNMNNNNSNNNNNTSTTTNSTTTTATNSTTKSPSPASSKNTPSNNSNRTETRMSTRINPTAIIIEETSPIDVQQLTTHVVVDTTPVNNTPPITPIDTPVDTVSSNVLHPVPPPPHPPSNTTDKNSASTASSIAADDSEEDTVESMIEYLELIETEHKTQKTRTLSVSKPPIQPTIQSNQNQTNPSTNNPTTPTHNVNNNNNNDLGEGFKKLFSMPSKRSSTIISNSTSTNTSNSKIVTSPPLPEKNVSTNTNNNNNTSSNSNNTNSSNNVTPTKSTKSTSRLSLFSRTFSRSNTKGSTNDNTTEPANPNNTTQTTQKQDKSTTATTPLPPTPTPTPTIITTTITHHFVSEISQVMKATVKIQIIYTKKNHHILII
eukprot:TRINITY_DN3359_c1_g2_i1.p1 TRINITY_DN3359_c1_g2~~TRINITY_DN3359_c1_g2_i1.p1  ORF type:complete len:1830 (+),score=475.91 TRINITY_DN3359_c1_g2_i1:100-5589(+)